MPRAVAHRPLLGAGLAVFVLLLGACTAAPQPAGLATEPAARDIPAAAPAGGEPSGMLTDQPASQPVAAPAVSAVKLTLVPAQSDARFRAREQLAGRSLPNDAVGTTKNVAGHIVLGPDGTIAPRESAITVDLASLTSDESRRDRFIKQSTLETATFPRATFVPQSAQGLPAPLPTSGQASFKLLGDLTVHGVTRPTVWDVTARFDGGSVMGTATTTVTLEDFGMSSPRVPLVLSIEPGIGLEIDFTAARGEAG